MEADAETSAVIRQLVDDTYHALSTPGATLAAYFGAEDMTVAGSGQSELFSGPSQVLESAARVSGLGHHWVAEQVRVWRRSDVAWAQIVGYYEVDRDGDLEQVPYRTIGVFESSGEDWRWVYWGGSQPIPDNAPVGETRSAAPETIRP
jgi:hypothetical protein